MRLSAIIFILTTIVISYPLALSATQPSYMLEAIEMSRFNPREIEKSQSPTRQKICLNGIWDFAPIFDKSEKFGPELEKLTQQPGESGWGKIRVPSKWSGTWSHPDLAYDMPESWQKADRAWYRRQFRIPQRMRGKRISLLFEGILVYSEIIVNGRSMGKHLGGITPFSVDITDIASFNAPNTLTVYVVNENINFINPPVSRYRYTVRAPVYYSYRQESAGIWRDVYLLAKPFTTVEDIQIITSVRKKTITANVKVKNYSETSVNITVSPRIEELDGSAVADLETHEIVLGPSDEKQIKFTRSWDPPRTWSPEDPHLYNLNTRIFNAGQLIDQKVERFGFREFWIQGSHFMLNGRKISMRGTWTGFIGSGFDIHTRPEYVRLQLSTLKEANFLGPRIHLEAPHVFDIADEIGLPVIATVISDGPRFFDPAFREEGISHARDDITSLLKLHRNHPSILIWSTENEDNAPRNEKAMEQYREIDRIFKKMDPTRPFMHDGSRGFDYAPIENFHYDQRFSSLESQIHMLDLWQKTAVRPRIEGEIHPIANEFFWSGLFRYIGDRVWRDIDYRYAQWDRVIRLLTGGWRASGSSGFMLHGALEGMLKSPIYSSGGDNGVRRAFRLIWDDFATPSPKPKYLIAAPLDLFNPWVDSLPPVIRMPLFYTVKDAFNPVLVTLARSTEHTYWTREEIFKHVTVINEGADDINGAALTWHLSRRGIIIDSGEIPVDIKQGEIKHFDIRFPAPSISTPDNFEFQTVLTRNEKTISRDHMELTFYNRPGRLLTNRKKIYLYDATGRTAAMLRSLGIPFIKIKGGQIEPLETGKILIIGDDSLDNNIKQRMDDIESLASRGAIIIFLQQKTNEACSRSIAFIRAPTHPLFKDLPKESLMLWRSGSHRISYYNLPKVTAPGTTVLAETVENPKDKRVFSSYAPVITERKIGKGTIMRMNLDVTGATEAKEPEAVIMIHNLIEYAASFHDDVTRRVYYTGNKNGLSLLKENIELPDVTFVPFHKVFGRISDTDILLIGHGISSDKLERQKKPLLNFTESGGTIIFAGDWSEGKTRWLPVNLTVHKLDYQIKQPYMISRGAFHLWKESEHQILDGLGDLYLFRSKRAKMYFIADPIPGLRYGFVKPDSPWISGFGIATSETSSFKGKYRLPHYGSDGSKALVISNYGKGMLILSTIPLIKSKISLKLYKALMTNLRAY